MFTLLASKLTFSQVLNKELPWGKLNAQISAKLNFRLPVEIRFGPEGVEIPLHQLLGYEVDSSGRKLILNLNQSDKRNITLLLVKLSIVGSLMPDISPAGEQTLELIFNSQKGSQLAKYILLEYFAHYLKNVMPSFDNSRVVLEQWLAQLETEIELAKKHAEADLKNRQRKWEQYKLEKNFDALERMELKLNDYVKRNDRKNAAYLIESYLPWPLMEPLEKIRWQQWIESIRSPDFSNSVYLYRGLDDNNDPKQILELGGGKKNLGFFAPLLTKNQGNYNRRLRSLTTKRMGRVLEKKSSLSTFLFTDRFIEHANEPVASSFLSLTTQYEVAQRFANKKGGFLVVKMDPRRLTYNIMGLQNELEILVPLVIFPDEVVKHIDYNLMSLEDRAKMRDYENFKSHLSMEVLAQLEKTNLMQFNDFFTLWDKAMVEMLAKPTKLRCEALFLGN